MPGIVDEVMGTVFPQGGFRMVNRMFNSCHIAGPALGPQKSVVVVIIQ
jgi:hypothetical protein